MHLSLREYVPFGHVLVVEGHKDGIFGGVADRVEFPQQELDELLPALLRHDRKTIDDDECIQSLLELNFILRLEICCVEKKPAVLERGNKQSEKFLPSSRYSPEKSISSSTSSSWRSCSVRVSKLGAILANRGLRKKGLLGREMRMEESLALLCWSPFPGLGQKRTIPVLCAIAAESGLSQRAVRTGIFRSSQCSTTTTLCKLASRD